MWMTLARGSTRARTQVLGRRPLVFVWLLGMSLARTSAAVHYVDVNGSNPSAPYTNWTTAATVVQDAVDAAEAGDEIIVNDGVYAAGGRPVGTNLLPNRVAVTKPITLRSVNGPQSTIIQGQQVATTTNGDGAVRCVYLTNGVRMTGFTLRGGATRASGDLYHEQSGGGLWCESSDSVVSNCVLVGNAAAIFGGGALYGTLNNCTLSANWASSQGGGAWSGTLNNCLLSGNSATYGGGAESGTLNACNHRASRRRPAPSRVRRTRPQESLTDLGRPCTSFAMPGLRFFEIFCKEFVAVGCHKL
jgi:hypothetical protein